MHRSLLSVLVGIFDPAGRYMFKHGLPHPPRQRGKRFVGGAAFGPGVPGGARQATAEQLASLPERVRQSRARYHIALEAARSRWSEQAMACAGELLATGTAVLSVDGGEVRGQLIRFWRGDSVLALTAVLAPTASGHDAVDLGRAMARLSRGPNTSVDVIAQYLIHQVVQLQDRAS
jgi:hypothetical protein